MSLSFLPAMTAGAVTDIRPELLKNHGIKLLMLDFDNTIVPYTTNQPSRTVLDWFQAMKDGGILLCVVSNSRNSRVRKFCEEYGLDCITHAQKPFTKGIVACMNKYGLPPRQCALVGDQIYTDTLGANLAGVRAILVKAIDNHNFWLKARNVAELPFRWIAKNRRIKL